MYVDEDGILQIKIIEGAILTLENIEENYKAHKVLLGENKALLLIDTRVKYKFTKEARTYLADNNIALNWIATAFLVDSFTSRLATVLFIWLSKPIIPTRIFISRAKAHKWLKSFYVLPGDLFIKPKKK